jgi:hypothetical protein
MTTTARPTTGLPTPDEKREALRLVLQTPTFSRSGQLRNFLSFICEMEIAGRGAEISEYLIGVDALGRPPGYSTTDDSTVRRHAHALRQKLDEVYADEAAAAPLRIELPKGTYVPRFAEMPPPSERGPTNGDAGEPTPMPAAAPPVRESRVRPVLMLVGAFAAGAIVATFVGFALRAGRNVDAVVREAWAPFDRADSNPLVCVSAPPHIGILPYPDEGPLPDEVEALAKAGLVDWYREHYPLAPDQRLATHLATGPIRLGEVLALVAAVRTFERMGVPYELVAEKNVEVPVLRGRNLLLLANPEYSFAAAQLLQRAAWTVGYDPESRRRLVRPVHPNRTEKRTFMTPAGAGAVYGLITVLPSEGSRDRARKTVVVSCTYAAACHAAMEFFASPAEMRALRARFRGEGHAGFPPAYQVVVKAHVYKTQALSQEYAAHTVLEESSVRNES